MLNETYKGEIHAVKAGTEKIKNADGSKDNLPVHIIKPFDWAAIKLAALTTIGKKPKTPKLDNYWIKKAIISGHSILQFSQCLITADMPYKVASHLVRHNKKDGFYMLIQSQREDWTGEKRDPDRIVKTIITMTPKAAIEISRERFCQKAAKETTKIWLNIITALDKIIFPYCVPNCVYKGFCPEFNSCGYVKSDKFKAYRNQYLKDCVVDNE